jgi:soluble lytic murein transglycosylase-like protein
MITLALFRLAANGINGIIRENKEMRFCFKLMACGTLSLAALWGAAMESVPPRVTWVVRADRQTGKLVRVPVVQTAPGAATAKAAGQRVSEVVEAVAKQHAVDPLLVHSVIQAESNYDPFAVSPKGAQGMMQLMPSTARRFGVKNSFDFADNIEGGVRYLRYLMDLFQDEKLAVAAYNAGEQAVMRYGGVPPYPETMSYVRTVTGSYAGARQAAGQNALAKPEPAPKPVPEYREIEQFVDAQGHLCLRTR